MSTYNWATQEPGNPTPWKHSGNVAFSLAQLADCCAVIKRVILFSWSISEEQLPDSMEGGGAGTGFKLPL